MANREANSSNVFCCRFNIEGIDVEAIGRAGAKNENNKKTDERTNEH